MSSKSCLEISAYLTFFLTLGNYILSISINKNTLCILFT